MVSLTRLQRGSAHRTTRRSLLTLPQEGLVAYFPAEHNAGSIVYDESKNGLNGNIVGPTWTDGHTGYALSYDGTDDYCDLGTPAALQLTGEMTIQAILTIADKTGDRAITTWANGNWTTHPFHVLYSSGADAWRFNSSDIGTAVDSAFTPAANTTYLVSVTRDSNGSIRFYTNGDPDANNPHDVNDTPTDGDDICTLGESDSQYFDGTMEEHAFWNRQLIDSEIKTIAEKYGF